MNAYLLASLTLICTSAAVGEEEAAQSPPQAGPDTIFFRAENNGAYAISPNTIVVGGDQVGDRVMVMGSTGKGQTHQFAASQPEKITYIGIATDEVPEVLAVHLPEVLKKGQGLLITGVLPDSPATKAGLQVNDVLLRYGDHLIVTPDQLSILVSSDQPEQKVTLSVIRAGKQQTVEITLGQREPSAFELKLDAQMQPFGIPLPSLGPFELELDIQSSNKADGTQMKLKSLEADIDSDISKQLSQILQANGIQDEKQLKDFREQIMEKIEQQKAVQRKIIQERLKSVQVPQSKAASKIKSTTKTSISKSNSGVTEGIAFQFSLNSQDGATYSLFISYSSQDSSNTWQSTGPLDQIVKQIPDDMPASIRRMVDEMLESVKKEKSSETGASGKDKADDHSDGKAESENAAPDAPSTSMIKMYRLPIDPIQAVGAVPFEVQLAPLPPAVRHQIFKIQKGEQPADVLIEAQPIQ